MSKIEKTQSESAKRPFSPLGAHGRGAANATRNRGEYDGKIIS
jgi:hypothetical protein